VKIPKDYIKSISDTVYCEFYSEFAMDVANKREAYMQEYPSQEYDTHTSKELQKHPDGYWMVGVQRYTSKYTFSLYTTRRPYV